MVRVPVPENLATGYADLVASYQALEKLVAALRETIASLEGRNAALENSLVNHACELELLRRKLYGARSERGGTSEQQLLLGELLEGEAKLREQIEDVEENGTDGEPDDAKKARRREEVEGQAAAAQGPPRSLDLEPPEGGRRHECSFFSARPSSRQSRASHKGAGTAQLAPGSPRLGPTSR